MPLDPLSDLYNLTPGAMGGAAGAAVAPVIQAATGFSFSSPTRIIMVAIGLLLIAAGIFSFDKTKELVVSGAKKGIEASKLAAAAA